MARGVQLPKAGPVMAPNLLAKVDLYLHGYEHMTQGEAIPVIPQDFSK